MSIKMEVALIENELNELRGKNIQLEDELKRMDRIIDSLECQLTVMTARVHKMVDKMLDGEEAQNEQTT